MPRRRRRWSASLLLAAGLVLSVAPPVPMVQAAPRSLAQAASVRAAPDAVVERRLIGRSVQKRPIYAYRLGRPGKPVVMLIATMHGNEAAPRQILRSLVGGAEVRGIDLWVVPTYNPDGLAAHTRRNARGVDLNRNFPYQWAALDGDYESGPRPRSEPETRAMMRFLREIRPHRILSFHQPLHGVDTDTKKPRFARRVGRALDLPRQGLHLRRRLPRHDDHVVQPPLRRRRRHRGVRPATAAPAAAGAGPPPGAAGRSAAAAPSSRRTDRTPVSGPRRPASPWRRTRARRPGGQRWRRCAASSSSRRPATPRSRVRRSRPPTDGSPP